MRIKGGDNMTEDVSGIFKPDAKNIIKIFGDADSYYQVPDYQRPYSWGDEQVEQLWDDIYSAMESRDESYFLGAMILIKTKDGYFEVVDGQQRLTTLTILFCVIRDLYGDKLKKLDKELISSIQDAIKSLVKGKHRLKLITQLHYQNEFEQEILRRVKFPTTTLTKEQKEQKKFINAALIFKQKLEEIEKKGGIEKIKRFAEFLLKNVEMITITCTKQNYAIKLFQILNTRGLDLNPADLVKSYLYSRLEGENERQQFISTWREIETLSKQMEEDITDLLTYYEYYLLAQNPKRSLYEELTNKFKKRNPNEIVYEFKRFIDCFNEICQTENKLMFSFWYLPNQVFWKAILTTAKYENYQDFKQLCEILRKCYYSYWIAGYTTTKIKQLSFNIIGWIKEKRSLKDIKKEIDAKMRDDDVIKWMTESLNDDVYGKPWLKPLLILIEYEQTDDSKITYIHPWERNLHVDHILPEKWVSVKDWKKKWNEAQADKWLNKLGNLTLLSGRKNIRASNNPFGEKKKIYKGKGFDGTTAFVITQRIIDEKDWTEESVKKRQQWMIEQIENIFGVQLQ